MPVAPLIAIPAPVGLSAWKLFPDDTDEVIVPFSDYTKVSCNSNGNYFKLNLTNWETNRSYYVEIKIDRSGVIEYFSDKDLTFTIEK